MRRLGCLLLGLTALAVFAGCSGRTTGASHITEQPNDSYSAKLNGVGSCERGSSSTPCTASMRWRVVGTNAWTNGPEIKVDGKVSNRTWSQTAKGLSPKASYEYQACGKEFSDKEAVCVGPDGGPETTQKFVTVERSAAHPEANNPGGGNESAAKGGESHPQRQGEQDREGDQNGAAHGKKATSSGSRSGGDEGGTFPLVPIAIGVGAGFLIGVAWWTRREAYW